MKDNKRVLNMPIVYPYNEFVHAIELYCELPRRRLSEALPSAQAHISLALAQTALPWEKTEQRQDGALKDTFARETAKLLMTTNPAGSHEEPQWPEGR